MNETKQLLLTRRTELVNELSHGAELAETIKILAVKYEVNPAIIRNDWGRRNTWLQTVTRSRDPALLETMLQGMREVIRSCWVQYATADNSNAKVGALRLAMDTYTRLIQILQSMGIIIKVPEKLSVDVNVVATLREYDQSIRTALEHNIQAKRLGEPVDTAETHHQTS